MHADHRGRFQGLLHQVKGWIVRVIVVVVVPVAITRQKKMLVVLENTAHAWKAGNEGARHGLSSARHDLLEHVFIMDQVLNGEVVLDLEFQSIENRFGRRWKSLLTLVWSHSSVVVVVAVAVGILLSTVIRLERMN